MITVNQLSEINYKMQLKKYSALIYEKRPKYITIKIIID